eukprot:CAMPEP_0197898118 /NCGR_PEP_ID=MMETSP1439-20131203/43295_1 /TAXON_ID=66791 /ORGANISM="Gonyaulax spinifera, Strain CCMP409" /LENGTH=682 /DNA_ID=CAMNT_0043518811 /DNA_START=58 /DNA_END=2102 /DNA_ORIENTATION=+
MHDADARDLENEGQGRLSVVSNASRKSSKEPQPQKHMFADAQSMKDRMKQNLMSKPKYEVTSFYKKTGFCQAVARSQKFEYATLSVIALNALWISIDTDLNQAEMLLGAHPVFQVAEHFFCMYFTFEWTMRFGAFQIKRNGLRDSWFVFDSIMVFMMVGETWVMTGVIIMLGGGASSGFGNASILRLLRLLRLSRMARMAKLLRSMPELLILIKGMASAMRSVFFTLILLSILLYVFAIAFRQLTADTPAGEKYFSTIINAMHTLLIDGTLLDGTGSLVKTLEEAGVVYVVILYMFILLSALTVMNMLIGVLCEVVSAVAATEKESITVSLVKDGILDIIDKGGLDTNGDRQISKTEFEAILDNPDAVRLLNKVEVDPYALVDLADYIFAQEDDEEDEKQLSFEDFMEVILSLRGCNICMVRDMVDLRKMIKEEITKLEGKLTTKGLIKIPAKRGSGKGSNNPQEQVREVKPEILRHADLAETALLTIKDPNELSVSDSRQLVASASAPSTPFATRSPEPGARGTTCGGVPQDAFIQALRLEGVLCTAQNEVERFLACLPPSLPPSSSGARAGGSSSSSREGEHLSSSTGGSQDDGTDAHPARSASGLIVHAPDPLPVAGPAIGIACLTSSGRKGSGAEGIVTPSTRSPSEGTGQTNSLQRQVEDWPEQLRAPMARLGQALT